MKTKHDILELSNETIKLGFIESERYFECLACGREVEKGLVYKEGETFYEARRFIENHIARSHGSVFEFLLGLDKKVTGLSDHQIELLKRFYKGFSDQQIQQELKIGSTSTVRNHRFALKEKERQARIFMTLMELMREHESEKPRYVQPHATATMVDDRYKVTIEENDEILKKYFPEGLEGQLSTFKMKEKCKLVVLRHIARRIEPGRIYSEKEINELLQTVFNDHVTIRRYLIEYGFLDRKPDCSAYWLLSKEENTGRTPQF
ncbi:MAG: DUF2087 domain-containing protein [Candidatus Riflebacteria bacterium]|nr:DUF2087 domain-containing protein [Candidatus Riflebacteria bacterium]